MIDGPPRPAAIVFDWDNTLVDTWPVIHESLMVTLSAMGHEPWTFEELSASDVHVAVLSNKTGMYLRAEALHLGWSGYFDSLVGAGDAARDKPAPESLQLALARAPVQPGPKVWIVGDAGIDMEIAHRTGCLPVLLHRDAGDPEFAAWPPTHCFASCRGLLEYITGW